MRNQPPVHDPNQGAEEVAGHLMAILADEKWPLESHTAVLWKVRQRIARASSQRPRSMVLRGAAAGVLAAAALALIAYSVRGPELLRAVAGAAVAEGLRSGAPVEPSDDSSVAPRWYEVVQPDLGLVEFAGNESFELNELPWERQLRIGSGKLRAQIVQQDSMRPLVVITPHLRVVVVGTRFDVITSSTLTRVDLIEGSVRVESPTGAVQLMAGMSVQSDDPRLRPAEASPVAAPEQSPVETANRPLAITSRRVGAAPRAGAPGLDCERVASLVERRRCYEQLSGGDDLAAQNALFTLAVLARDEDAASERAADLFHAYVQRFPTGPFAPEAALGELEVFEWLGRVPEAVAAASEFERRFAADSRAPRVALVRAQLTCRDPERRAEALQTIARFAARHDPSLGAALERAGKQCAAEAAPPGSDSARPSEAGPPRD